MRPRLDGAPHLSRHTPGRALRAMHYRTPPRLRRTPGSGARRRGARGSAAVAAAATAAGPAAHVRAADAAAAYASAAVCVVAAAVVACALAGIARAVYADVARKTRARAAEFAAVAAECAREFADNDCAGRVGSSAVGRMCREWSVCLARGEYAEWDAVSGVVWAEAVSECGRAFVDGAGGMPVVFAICCSLVVFLSGSSVLWQWLFQRSGSRTGTGRSDGERGEWIEVVDNGSEDEEIIADGDDFLRPPMLPRIRGYGDGNKMLLTPRRPATFSISRQQLPAPRR